MKEQSRYRRFIQLRNGVLAALLAGLLAGCAGIAGGQTPAADADAKPLLGDFKAKDTSGNEITNDFFADYDVTMVNIWATTCPPCVGEMPDLAALNGEYGERSFQVVGIILDATDGKGNVDEAVLADAMAIIESTGADYTHILPTAAMFGAYLKNVSAVPTTVFLDSGGRIIGKAYTGALSKEKWAAAIEDKLG